MLVDFSVENFLSFKDRQTISFEPDTKVKGLEKYYFITIPDLNEKKKPLQLLKIGMIYGANASGKSNFLSALSYMKTLMCQSQERKELLLNYKPFANNYQNNSIMEANFVFNRVKYNYKVEFNKYLIVSEELSVYPYLTSSSYKYVYKRHTDFDKQVPIISFNPNLKVDPMVQKEAELRTLPNETVLAGFSKYSADIKPMKEVKDWCEMFEVDLVSPKLPIYYYAILEMGNNKNKMSNIAGLLQNADFNISSVRVEEKHKTLVNDVFATALGKNISSEASDYIRNNVSVQISSGYEGGLPDVWLTHKTKDGAFELPLTLESDGTQRYLGLIGVLSYLVENSGIIILDELESSLHPELYEAFIVTYLKKCVSSQLLFTTHNREFLQRKELIRKDSLWITNKRDDASSELYSFADFDSSVLRNTTSIYNAYSIGKLGGVPNVSNDLMFYIKK